MTIREILDYGRKSLSQAKIEYPGLEAEILLSGILNKDRVYFYTHHQDLVDSASEENYRQAIKRRTQFEPVAYILGKKEFMGLDFLVDQQVLIPRPDTESMVEYLIEYLKADFPDGAKILDLCTGSGAIGISIKRFYNKGQVTLCDISDAALTVARENANRLVNGDLLLYQGDLLAAIPQGETFTVIVSNPPYIRRAEMKQLAPDIIAYEPHLALDGGEFGLDFYRRIISEAPLFLEKNGLLALEVGDDQVDSVTDLLIQWGYCEIKKTMDLGGHVRCLTGKLAKVNPTDNNKLG